MCSGKLTSQIDGCRYSCAPELLLLSFGTCPHQKHHLRIQKEHDSCLCFVPQKVSCMDMLWGFFL